MAYILYSVIYKWTLKMKYIMNIPPANHVQPSWTETISFIILYALNIRFLLWTNTNNNNMFQFMSILPMQIHPSVWFSEMYLSGIFPPSMVASLQEQLQRRITTGLWDSGADSQKLCHFYKTFQSANICAQAVVYLILIWKEILKISFKTSTDI